MYPACDYQSLAMAHAQHCDVQPSRPINGSAFNRYLTLSAIAVLKRIRPFKGPVLMLTDRICVKFGQDMDLSEAATLRFLSQNTSLPVPKVLCAFTRRYVLHCDGKDQGGNSWRGLGQTQ